MTNKQLKNCKMNAPLDKNFKKIKTQFFLIKKMRGDIWSQNKFLIQKQEILSNKNYFLEG